MVQAFPVPLLEELDMLVLRHGGAALVTRALLPAVRLLVPPHSLCWVWSRLVSAQTPSSKFPKKSCVLGKLTVPKQAACTRLADLFSKAPPCLKGGDS